MDERVKRMVVLLLTLLRLTYDYGYSFVPLVFVMSSSSNLIEFDYKVELVDIVPCVLYLLMMGLVEMMNLETHNYDLNVERVKVMCHNDASMIVERRMVGQAGVY